MTGFRATRSVLATPGSNSRMIEKALASEADVVMIDLEDAVAPAEKAAARETVAAALRGGDWRGRPRTFRINALDTPWFARDLVSVYDLAEGQIDLIVLPKTSRPGDVRTVGTILTSLESPARQDPILLDVQIESAAGLAHCEAIAACSQRVASLVFGPGDYAASVRMPLAAIGMPDTWDAAYPGHRWDYALQRILVAARAAGVLAIDGPFADFRDLEGFRRSCLLARALGYDGKWCIHPAQVPVANVVFAATAEEIAWAEEVLAANAAAAAEGRGSFALHGQMVDAATLRMAAATLARAGRTEAGATPAAMLPGGLFAAGGGAGGHGKAGAAECF